MKKIDDVLDHKAYVISIASVIVSLTIITI